GVIFHKDPLFMEVSSQKKFWDGVIEQFYDKYKGLHKWHISLLNTVVSTGKWVNPTGRVYTFERQKNPWTGQLEWPRTQILNYPVQGLAADTMALTRVLLHQHLLAAGVLSDVKQIATVHDSILLDLPTDQVPKVASMVQKAFDDVPAAFEAMFGVPFDLPYRCEITIGPNKKDMKKWDVGVIL
ncbi:MAG: DNA polymerase, partial [Nitrososphaera sp.]|nr:DNA polymerase [Nitrososphaera sp.]